jgi:hypothetical protein
MSDRRRSSSSPSTTGLSPTITGFLTLDAPTRQRLTDACVSGRAPSATVGQRMTGERRRRAFRLRVTVTRTPDSQAELADCDANERLDSRYRDFRDGRGSLAPAKGVETTASPGRKQAYWRLPPMLVRVVPWRSARGSARYACLPGDCERPIPASLTITSGMTHAALIAAVVARTVSRSARSSG